MLNVRVKWMPSVKCELSREAQGETQYLTIHNS